MTSGHLAGRRVLSLLPFCFLACPRGAQSGQCSEINETDSTDSGGDPCAYYDGNPHHCGCCETSSFSSWACCACQGASSVGDGNGNGNGNASWWTSVFQSWPRKATRLRLPGKGIQAAFPSDVAERWPFLEEIDLSHNQLSGGVPSGLGGLSNLSHLDLSDNQLSGPVPGELGQMTELRHLDLSSNQLQGGLAAELGNLTSLEIMCLHVNQLSGSLPPELGQLTGLQSLQLHSNDLSGRLPSALGDLSSLEVLYLNGNSLSGVLPAELGNLAKLQHLRLHSNQLTGSIPPELGALASLRSLDLSSNSLSGGLPAELGHLGSLEILSAGENKLNGSLPAELGKLGRLQGLLLGSNHLSGSIPPEVGRLTSLVDLHLFANDLTGGLPPGLGALGSLERLYLNDNKLSGGLPAELGGLEKLQRLHAQNNQLSGHLPPELGALRSLQRLWLNDNHLDGCLPPQLSQLGQLEEIRLFRNQLSGGLPPQLGNLSRLRDLYLYGNRLNGSIPEELGQLTSLRFMRMSDNQFSGSLPAALGNLGKTLEYLEFRNNMLTGSLPPELGNLERLRILNVRINQLSGHLPPHLGNLSRLEQLQVHDNQFSGSIPAELGNLGRLKYFYLQKNRFEGSLPPELGKLASLLRLSVYTNRLTGSVPPELGDLAKLTQLSLHLNDLSGPLPRELGKLTKLTRLLVHYNRLTGGIPPELGQLTRLTRLSMNENQFNGSIPAELGNLVRLQMLHLNDNQLSGSLPASLGNLQRLQQLSLQDNNLSGGLPSSFGQLQQLSLFRTARNPLLCGGGEVLQNLTSLATLDLRGCCFTDIPALPPKLTFLDVGGNRLSEIPKRWQEQDLQLARSIHLDGNRITHWDISATVPQSYRKQNSWLCGYRPPGQRFRWPLLERLDVSQNPLKVPVYEFLESLSHLTMLSVLQAHDANLTGEVLYIYGSRMVPGVPHTGDNGCSNFPNPSSAWVSFPALLTLDLAGNGIEGMPAVPTDGLVQADLSRNDLRTLNSVWLQAGRLGNLQRVDARGNPKLKLPTLLQAAGSCPALGVDQLTANAQGWNVMGDGRTECTSLCQLAKTRVMLDATVNESVLCRCAQGQGTGLDCSPCPTDTYSSMFFEKQTQMFRRRCLACPAHSTSSGGEGVCFADCECTKGHYMVQIFKDGNVSDTGASPCAKLTSEGRCESCGVFKTSPPGSRKQSDCFCNSVGWKGLLEREGVCGCPEGLHMNYEERTCEECLPEEDCSNWTRSLAPPRVKAGFWAPPPPPQSSDGTYGQFARHYIWTCRSSSACPGNSLCGENRVGTACSLCKQGYFTTPSGSCARCPRSHTQARQLLAILLLACMVFPILAQTALTADTHSRGLMMTLRSLRTSLRQVVKFAQVLGLVSLFRVEWPPLVDSIFAIFRAFSLDFASWTGVACLDHEQQQSMTLELVFRWMLPLAGIFITCLAAFLVTVAGRVLGPVYARWCPRREARIRELLSFPPLDILRVLLFFLYLLFPSLLKNTLLPLTCSPSPNGLLNMNAWPHVTCYGSVGEEEGGGSEESFWTVAVAGLLQSAALAFGLPVILFFAWRRIERSDTPQILEERKQWWAFVFEDFRSHKASWALVAVCKDIVLNLVVVLLPGLGTAQLLLTAIVSVVYACRAFCTAPYRDMSNNLLEICTSGAIATLCLFSAGMGFQTEPDMPDLGEHIEGGRDGDGYLVRAISLVCLQGLSLVGPAFILTFQVLMSFERCRRRIPKCLQPMSDEQREEWSQLFAAAMGLEGSALPRAVAEMDNLDFSVFQRSVTAAKLARDSLQAGTSSLGLSSTSLDFDKFYARGGHSSEESLPALQKESAHLRQIAEHSTNSVSAVLLGQGVDIDVKMDIEGAALQAAKARHPKEDHEVDRLGRMASDASSEPHFRL